MASQAEVDLIVSTADALPDLERDLNQIIRTAEDGAPELDVQASLAVQNTIAQLSTQLSGVVNTLDARGDNDIDMNAALDTLAALGSLRADLDQLTRLAAAGEDPIQLRAEMDLDASLAEVRQGLDDLVATAEAGADDIDIDVDVDRDGSAEGQARRLQSAFLGLARGAGSLASTVGTVGLAAGTAVPLMAGLAAAVESILPASAVAVSGLLTLKLATTTVQVAMIGVGDAVDTAFDPDASPEDLAKSMERLAPEAKAFVTELAGMRKELTAIQQSVQNRFFAGFDESLQSLAKNVLPLVAEAGRLTADSLNRMARGAATAAVDLGKDGTLGAALESSVTSLRNLERVPGQATTALGQLAAAAGPSLERLTAAAGKAATGIGERLGAAFESGALENAITGAIDTISQLGDIAGNVFEGIGNIFSTVTGEGEGLFSVLEQVTSAFAEVTATKGFQSALTALSETVGVLVANALPLITTALQALGPVFEVLAPPIQTLIKSLGGGLTKIVEALAPVLVALGEAFGKLVVLVTPFIDLAAELISALLPGLVPLFEALGQTFAAMLPFVTQLVSNLAAQLLPVFTKLATEVLPQILPPLVDLSTRIFPILTDILIQLAPSLSELAQAFAEVLVEIAPLIAEFAVLTAQLLDDLMPIIQPLITLILKLVTGALTLLADFLTGVVVPAIQILVSLLQGDFSGAWRKAQDLVSNVGAAIQRSVVSLKDRAVAALGDLARQAVAKISQMGSDAKSRIGQFVSDAVAQFRALPGKITGALGNLGGLLVSAGGDIVRGLIRGLQSQIPSLLGVAQGIADKVTSTVKGALGISSPSKVMAEVGEDTGEGFLLGLERMLPRIEDASRRVAMTPPSFALPSGQSLALSPASIGAPTVNVYIGNEQLTHRIDTRIAQANSDRDRILTQGVRR